MKFRSLPLLGTAFAVLFSTMNAHALLTVTNDGPFSVGYGYSPSGFWGTNETAAANTPTTAPNPNGGSFSIGDYTFTVSVANSLNSSGGPVFTNRVLSNGDGGQVTAQSQFTTVSITGTYSGPNPPLDAEPGPTGFILNIDQISVYAHKHPVQLGGTDNEIWWIESTGTNPGVSPSFFAPQSASFTLASDFGQLAWNPSEFFVASGTNDTRTFSFPTDRNFMIDGLEIIGRGSFVYMIPEPSSVVLILATAVFFRRMRNRA